MRSYLQLIDDDLMAAALRPQNIQIECTKLCLFLRCQISYSQTIIQPIMKKQAQIDIISPSIHSLQPSFFPSNRNSVSVSPISKRLRYCLRTKASCEHNNICNKFNDTKCFYENNGAFYENLRESNLLKHPQSKQQQGQREIPTRAQQRPESIKIINIDCLNTERCQTSSNKHAPRRPNSMLESSVLRENNKKRSRSRKSSSSINPYTQQEYLYFGRKEKEAARQVIQSIRRKELEQNILKPCQVVQKQISSREYCRPSSTQARRRPQTAKVMPKHTFSRNQAKDQLQPWEHWVSLDDNL